MASTDNLVPLDVCTPTFPPGLHQYSRSWVVGCFCVKVRGAGWGLKRRFDDVLGVWGGGGRRRARQHSGNIEGKKNVCLYIVSCTIPCVLCKWWMI